jgi:hypothetical protein
VIKRRCGGSYSMLKFGQRQEDDHIMIAMILLVDLEVHQRDIGRAFIIEDE